MLNLRNEVTPFTTFCNEDSSQKMSAYTEVKVVNNAGHSQSETDFTKDIRFKKIQNYFMFNDVVHYAQDFGCMVSKTPKAVFMPPTVEVLQQFLQLANEYQLQITLRGKGNSAYGQAQVKDGVVIDLKNMEGLLKFDSETALSVTCSAFKTWLEVTEFTKLKNKTIPVTVDNLDLTVGGTLSFAALGGTSYRCGSGSDNILSLDVVTLDGKFQTCSKTENSELFDAVLCGMGQFAIIINATIPLITAKKQANVYSISYDNSAQFFKDQQSLYDSQVFDHLKGSIRKKDGKWEYVIDAVSYYDEAEDQCITDKLTALSINQPNMQTMSYWESINQVTEFVKSLRDNGKLNAPHPWYNVLMPEQEIEAHVAKVLDTPYLTGTEPIIVYPMNSENFQQPLFIKPEGRTFYLLGVLYNTSFEAREDFPYDQVLERNKKLYLEAKEVGGCRYPVDAIPFTPEDWSIHYGEKWTIFRAFKEKYDPHYLLSAGQNGRVLNSV